MAQNATFALTEPHRSYLATTHPWYYNPDPQLCSVMSDLWLTLLAPIIGFWLFCSFFEILDRTHGEWLKKYKIHENSEITSRNRITKSQVLAAVVFQQSLQVTLGYFWMDTDGETGGPVSMHVPRMEAIAPTVLRTLEAAVGSQLAAYLWLHKAQDIVYYVYWWAIPFTQFLAALFFIDTWQYFSHRAMHMNKFLYKTIHSWHHRLYVPYSFGGGFNHPIEGFFLDLLGSALAEWITGMSIRQAGFLFTFSTFKTIDDHAGWSLPFDPLQWFTRNNADYHDIHHQAIGMKYNFAQPFFLHWDILLGTRMTRQDVEARRQRKPAEAKSS